VTGPAPDARVDPAYDAEEDQAYDAIVLAGGASSRMSVPDKTRLEVGGVSLLDRVLAAAAGARRVVVVGDRRPTTRVDAVWTREHPAGSGPAAGVAAGLALVRAGRVVLLAGDLPFVTADAVHRLLAATDGPVGAVAVDGQGREQWLLSSWPTRALLDARLEPGGSLRMPLTELHPARVLVDPLGSTDCDTPDDLRRARELA
jgi:molybdopterin-guanine dinucleotide biosynthesis protein A